MTILFEHNGKSYTRLEDFIGANLDTFEALADWLALRAQNRERIENDRFQLTTVGDALMIPRASARGFANDLATWSAFHVASRAKAAKMPAIFRHALRIAAPTEFFNWKDDGKVETNLHLSLWDTKIGTITSRLEEDDEPVTTFKPG